MSTELKTIDPPRATTLGALVPQDIQQAMNLANMMADASLMPEHLRGKPSDCLLIVMQAQRWGMDALSVAQCTSIVKGKLCYEGKLVAAALYSMGVIDGRIRYGYSGSGSDRKVVVSARPRGAAEDAEIEGTVTGWSTNNEQWKRDPDGMLAYRGVRQWARRHAPDALLGVYTPDELEDPGTQTVLPRVQSVQQSQRQDLQPYSDADFQRNAPTWRGLIERGQRTPAEIIAMVSSKGVLSVQQQDDIRAMAMPEAAA